MTVKTQSQSSHDLRLAARRGLLPSGGRGWFTGFGPMFSKEMGEWFHTRRWLWQLLIWLVIINGFTALMIWVVPMITPGGTIPPDVTGMMYYFIMVAFAGTVGVVILAQDEIIQEKSTGTAAWILSKPTARPAFILTKLASNITGAILFIVVFPGLVIIGEIYLAARLVVPLAPFLAGVGVIMLSLVFYISLVIMLGTLFEARGPVLGIAIAVIFLGRLAAQYLPKIALATPFTLDGIALGLASNSPLSSMAIVGIIVTAIFSIVFILVALWRFQHTEL